jgi:methylated-DNA-protein-cysteine methyltransferase-like protein
MARRTPTPSPVRILRAVAAIPVGVVATYGEVAARAGLPGRARLVGTVLATLGDDAVPWHRVVNASRRISVKGDAAREQRRRLEREGVEFDALERIVRAHFRWAAVAVAPRRRDAATSRARHR